MKKTERVWLSLIQENVERFKPHLGANRVTFKKQRWIKDEEIETKFTYN